MSSTHDLNDLRTSLDHLDNALLFILAERFRVTKKVGEYKKVAGLQPVDPAREEAQFARIRQKAEEAGLDPEFATAMLRLIIDRVVEDHKRIIAG